MQNDLGKPLFFDVARGWADEAYLVPPPFSYPGVTARVFPLRANMNVLSSFCQRYLNVLPKEVCYLRPALPCVLLVILDYGEMALETANLGWVAQHEVLFEVPLERWRRVQDRMVFEGWVLNTPFIFVDNAASLTTGREVYGWPKVLASLQPSLEEWLVDPRNPVQLLSLRLRGVGGRGADKKIPLLEVDHRLGQSPSLVPSDLTEADPLHWLSRFTRNTWLSGVGLTELLMRAPLAGFGPRMETGGDAAILLTILRQLFRFFRKPGVDVVTLKQFRDAIYPDQSCYQALVKSRLGLDRFNHGGLLGVFNLLQGDPSGGFHVHLYDDPVYPIAAALGLQSAQERTIAGRTVSTFEPFFPFWMSVDLTYNTGENLGWRMFDPVDMTSYSSWSGEKSTLNRPLQSSYNTVAGAAQQEWVGPYSVPKCFCDVFPLRVHQPHRLSKFIKRYLNQGEQDRFELWGDHVYMLASRSRIFSQARSAAVSEIAFFVPLLWYGPADKLPKGFAFAKPFAFVDDPTFAMTLREVQGVPAMDATIETPKRAWLRGGPVLRMQADVFTVLEAGMGSERRTVLEVMCGLPSPPMLNVLQAVPNVPPPGPEAPPPAPGGTPSLHPPDLLDQARKVFLKKPAGGSPAGDTGLEEGNRIDMPVLTLKQFRDVEQPANACYRSLVLEPWSIFFGTRPQRLPHGTEVHVYRYPSLPVAQTLGLVDPNQPPTQSPKKKEMATVDVLKPDHPFRIEIEIEMKLGKVLSRTAGNLPWIRSPQLGKATTVTEEVQNILSQSLNAGPQMVVEFLLDRFAVAGPAHGGWRVGARRGGEAMR
ncbi:MAG TPA: hypothetical protein VGM86_19150 [Thermoanaerobaculia bacterium]